MEPSNRVPAARPTATANVGGGIEGASTGVSWGAILGGSFAAAALSLILILLGSGLGFAAISPWSNDGASAKTVGIAAIVWLIIIHLAASSFGGYLGGRLRTKWVDVHTDEVYFRDTAHGLLTWAVSIVLTAAFLTSAATALVSGAAKVGGAAVATAATAAGAGVAAAGDAQAPDAKAAHAYLTDSLFRSDRPRAADDSAMREETGRILASGLRQGDLPAADRAYLSQTVAARTGLSPPEADKRVADIIAQAKAAEVKAREAADAARKAAAHLSLWMFVALLIGAFSASYAALIGGRQRDSAGI